MDKSKEYIEMSDCPEIRKNWKFELGDFYYSKRDGVAVLHSGTKLLGEILGRLNFDLVPLPRQDQLQDMCGHDYPERLFRFYDFVQKMYLYNPNEFTCLGNHSMEQLWLAFVMKEKGKVWKEGKWE